MRQKISEEEKKARRAEYDRARREQATPEQRAERLKQRREHYEKNKEEYSAKAKIYYQEHQEELKAKSMERYYQGGDELKEKKNARRRERSKEEKEKIRQYEREYRQTHREIINAQTRARWANRSEEEKEKTRAYRQGWRDANREKIAERNRAWYAENREEVSERRRQLRESVPKSPQKKEMSKSAPTEVEVPQKPRFRLKTKKFAGEKEKYKDVVARKLEQIAQEQEADRLRAIEEAREVDDIKDLSIIEILGEYMEMSGKSIVTDIHCSMTPSPLTTEWMNAFERFRLVVFTEEQKEELACRVRKANIKNNLNNPLRRCEVEVARVDNQIQSISIYDSTKRHICIIFKEIKGEYNER